MIENIPERCILMRSRQADGYHFSESGRKNLQHVLTDWIPRAIHAELTHDTVSVDVEITKDYVGGKLAFGVTFKRADDTIIKNAIYAEERVIGKVCHYYNPKTTRYDGNRDGYDCRIVYYEDALAKTIPMARAR